MSFQSREKRRLAAIAAEFGATTHVLPYEQLVETLHPSYRERTLAYFAKHKIKWWVSRYDV